MKKYDHKKIEKKWQDYWDENQTYKTSDDLTKKKFYTLVEFPYPSGAGVHVGHAKGHNAVDVFARYKRMNGYNVLIPMGFDAFGLPAENFAIKNKKHPGTFTQENINNFIKQIKQFGCSFDWSRKIDTTDPKYYKWTQWIFLKLFEMGLAYEKEAPINWCPSCKTGLANEEVINGKCERCDSEVEQRNMRQWFLKITDYAEKLIKDLDNVNWPEYIKTSQKNWIGKSEGAEINFKMENSNDKITVFTTRVDTIFGCTYVVLAPENKIIESLKSQIKNISEVEKYIEIAKNKKDLERTDLNKDKSGVKLDGIFAINPFNNEKVEIWVADYVLGSYGTGAVMAVPAHDERDMEFAKKYNLKIKTVIEPVTGVKKENEEFRKSIVALLKDPKTDKVLSINWGNDLGGNLLIGGGLENNEDALECAKREILEETGYKNFKLIDKSEKINHHYFAFSKNVARSIEAYGFYFELIDKERVEQKLEENEKNKFSVEWLDKNDLENKIKDPLHLYLFEKFINNKFYTDDGVLFDSEKFSGLDSVIAREQMIQFAEENNFGKRKINYKFRDWLFSRQRYWGEPIPVIKCPQCGNVAIPESELPLLLPEVENYEPTGTGESPLAAIESWVNTTCPKCGCKAKRETNTMPQWAGSSWYFLRYIDPHNDNALASKEKLEHFMPVDIYFGGAEHTTVHLLYSRFWNKALYDAGIVPCSEPYKRRVQHGLIMGEDGRKMSKRWGNVINPDDVIEQYGADTMRTYIMFMGPYGEGGTWSTAAINGVDRFINRVWSLQEKNIVEENDDKETLSLLNKTIKKVGEDIENISYHTALSQLMILLNYIYPKETISKNLLNTYLKLLAPFAPHVTEEIYQNINGQCESIHLQKWPEYNEVLMQDEEVNFVISINGKMRDIVKVNKDISQEEIESISKSNEKIKKYLEGQNIKKTIFVKNKMINFVI